MSYLSPGWISGAFSASFRTPLFLPGFRISWALHWLFFLSCEQWVSCWILRYLRFYIAKVNLDGLVIFFLALYTCQPDIFGSWWIIVYTPSEKYTAMVCLSKRQCYKLQWLASEHYISNLRFSWVGKNRGRLLVWAIKIQWSDNFAFSLVFCVVLLFTVVFKESTTTHWRSYRKK